MECGVWCPKYAESKKIEFGPSNRIYNTYCRLFSYLLACLSVCLSIYCLTLHKIGDMHHKHHINSKQYCDPRTIARFNRTIEFKKGLSSMH